MDRNTCRGLYAFVAVLSAVSACGTPERATAIRVRDTTTLIPPRVLSAGDPACPRDGLWKPCAVIDRLVHAGLFFEATGDSMRVGYLTPPGVRFRVGKSGSMVVFFYADAASAARDLAPLDTARLTPRGDSVGAWPSRPTVIRSANLVMAMFASDGRQIERVSLAITAGAPQPYSVPILPSVPSR